MATSVHSPSQGHHPKQMDNIKALPDQEKNRQKASLRQHQEPSSNSVYSSLRRMKKDKFEDSHLHNTL